MGPGPGRPVGGGSAPARALPAAELPESCSRMEVEAARVVFAEVHVEAAARPNPWFLAGFLSSLSPEATLGTLPPWTCSVLWVTHRPSRPSRRQGAG